MRRLAVVVALALLLSAGVLLVRAVQTAPSSIRPVALIVPEQARVAATVGDDLPQKGHRTVLLFLRDGMYGRVVDALAAGPAGELFDLQPTADVVVVIPHRPTDSPIVTGIARDPRGTLAAAYGMPRPRGGGAPVGYAVVDPARRVRYVALEPDLPHELGQVVAVASAAR